jgi:hypothetical protein
MKGVESCGTESVADYINVYAYGAGAWITCQADSAGVAGTYATRTKNWSGGAAVQAAAMFWGFSDMPTGSGSPPSWAIYSEARKYPGTTGPTVTLESDISNFKAHSALDPYATSYQD